MARGNTTSRNALPVRASEMRAVGFRRSSTSFRKRSGNLWSRSSSGGEESRSSPPPEGEGAGGAGSGPTAGGGIVADIASRGEAPAGHARAARYVVRAGGERVVAVFCGRPGGVKLEENWEGVPSCPVV
jgi:hypothetical protein